MTIKKTFKKMTNILPDSIFISLEFYRRLGRFPDLKKPKTFNEKLQWLKLHDRNPEYSRMVDKYESKRYVAEKIGEEYVVPNFGVWDHFDEIDFDALPNQFVLKTVHDCGGVVICKGKTTFDKTAAKQFLQDRQKQNYFWQDREWPYKNVKPRILAEQFMEDAATGELRDYKFFCFNGETKVFYITSGRKAGDRRTDYFDMNLNHLDIQDDDENAEIPPAIPQNFQLMKQIAEKISMGIPQLRVDFYEVNGKVYVGELTFFYLSGFVPFKPEKWDEIFGEWIDLSIVKKEKHEP